MGVVWPLAAAALPARALHLRVRLGLRRRRSTDYGVYLFAGLLPVDVPRPVGATTPCRASPSSPTSSAGRRSPTTSCPLARVVGAGAARSSCCSPASSAGVAVFGDRPARLAAARGSPLPVARAGPARGHDRHAPGPDRRVQPGPPLRAEQPADGVVLPRADRLPAAGWPSDRLELVRGRRPDEPRSSTSSATSSTTARSTPRAPWLLTLLGCGRVLRRRPGAVPPPRRRPGQGRLSACSPGRARPRKATKWPVTRGQPGAAEAVDAGQDPRARTSRHRAGRVPTTWGAWRRWVAASTAKPTAARRPAPGPRPGCGRPRRARARCAGPRDRGRALRSPDERVAGVVEGEHQHARRAAGPGAARRATARRSSGSSKWSRVEVDSTPSNAPAAKAGAPDVGHHRAAPALAGLARRRRATRRSPTHVGPCQRGRAAPGRRPLLVEVGLQPPARGHAHPAPHQVQVLGRRRGAASPPAGASGCSPTVVPVGPLPWHRRQPRSSRRTDGCQGTSTRRRTDTARRGRTPAATAAR